jgi:hypothetical protein
MPRRKAAVEVLPPEESNQSSQPRQKVVEVKHKTEWSELRPVEEGLEDAELDLADDQVIEEKPKRRINNEREELRKKLAKNHVTPGSELKLTIEKYSHSDVVDGQGGMFAATEHCAKYVCNEAHITSEDYLDVARNKFGAGLFRFTLRMKNQIVTAWDKRISAGAQGPIIQHANPNDLTSPQVIIQSTNGDGQTQQVPMSIKDIMKTQREALKEQLEMAKLMREAYGFAPEQHQEPKSEEEIIAGAIIKQPAVIETVVESIIKRVGVKGGSDSSDEPWWAGVLKDSITTGQLAPTVQGIVKALFPNGLFGGLFPGGQNNGQATMGQTTVQTLHMDSAQHPQQPHHQAQGMLPQAQSEGTASIVETGADRHGDVQTSQQQIIPEQHALSRLIQNCQRNVPVQVAFQQLINYADAINEQAPDYSIDGYIELLGSMETDQVIEFVKTIPGGEQIAALPHAASWTAELQRLIKESQEGEEE